MEIYQYLMFRCQKKKIFTHNLNYETLTSFHFFKFIFCDYFKDLILRNFFREHRIDAKITYDQYFRIPIIQKNIYLQSFFEKIF